MFIHTALVLTLISLVFSNDLELGPKEGGRKILDELRKASPLLWRRENAVYVRTTDDEIIHRIVVSDLRDSKDGIARVVEGGVGENEVLIELSSPGVLKGYEFHVEVYSIPNSNPKPKDTASVKDVTNLNDNSRIAGQRQKRSWFGASGEDYGSFSGSDESSEDVKDERVKPLEKKPAQNEKPKTDASTEKPQIPQETITNPRQIIDSIPPVPNAEESTAVPSSSTEQPKEAAQIPDVSSPQPLPLDNGLPAASPTDVNPSTLTADATAATLASADPTNLNATEANSPSPAQ